MKMKYLLLVLACISCISLNAQKKNKFSPEEFRNKKQAYITEKAGLTDEEAAKFFPIYFELQNQKKAINRKTWETAQKGKSPQTTEAEYEAILTSFIAAEEENILLDKEYLKKYQSVLSNKKIYSVLNAEIKFNRNMMKIMQQKE